MVRPRLIFLPFAAFVALSGYLGWQMGQPLSETDVLNHYAADWVDTGPEGAAMTDCYGLPGVTRNVWIIVTCAHAGGAAKTYYVGPRGQALPAPQGPGA